MRLTETAPSACSACFQAKPQESHVDFDVAFDGPTIPGGVMDGTGEISNTVTVTIDDLILCEQCLRSAAGLVGLVDPGDTRAELEQLQESNRLLVEKVRGLEDYTSKLDVALSAKPAGPQRQARKAVAA